MKNAAGVSVVAALAALFTLAAVNETNWVFQIRHFVGLSAVSCVLYDRPPRTGSTTIARALDTCFRTKGYGLVVARTRKTRKKVISDMLAVTGDHIGAVKGHLYMSGSDLKALQQGCHQVFYMTSCRPMRDRLNSAIKYQLYKGHGNSTVLKSEYLEALKKAKVDRQERNLEVYPYVKEEVSEDARLLPDYVIRADHLMEDTRALLEKLGCQNQPVSDNVHAILDEDDGDEEEEKESGEKEGGKGEEQSGSGKSNLVAREGKEEGGTQERSGDDSSDDSSKGSSSSEVAALIDLQLNDGRYRALNELAETQNERGLRRAEWF